MKAFLNMRERELEYEANNKDLNYIAKCSYNNAISRGRIKEKMTHREIAEGIMDEFQEFIMANETKPSVHIPEYTEAAEELADIAISCFTELHRMNVDVERIITEKVRYNMTRKTNEKCS